MVSSIALSFFNGTSSSSSTTTTGVDASLLTAWASAKAGIGAEAITDSIGADPNAPTPPWTPGYTPADAALVSAALSGKAFFDPKAALYADLNMGDDYRQLFAMYQGVSTLEALATAAQSDTLSAAERARLQTTFARGVAEMQGYVSDAQFDNIRVAAGDRVDDATSKLGIPVTSEDYTTGVLVKGNLTSIIPGLPSDAKFDIVATSLGGTQRTVSIDLSQMGSLPRSIGSVVSFINGRLAVAGVATRLEAVNQAPKTQQVKVGDQTVTRAYTGLGQWALKVDVRANEKVAFNAPSTTAAFYALGTTAKGASLVKLEDTDGANGQPDLLTRPDPTIDPIGAFLASGFVGAGEPYQSALASATQTNTKALVADGDTATEALLKAAGEATVKVSLADGRTFTITTGWRAGDQEAWRVRSGETAEQGKLDDLAERITQLLHEQGIAAGVDSWTSGNDGGLSFYTADGVTIDSFTLSGRNISLEAGRDPSGGYVGGLRAGIYARRFETDVVASASDLFVGAQTFAFTTDSGAKTITIDGGEDGITGADLLTQLNAQLRAKGVPAAAELVDTGSGLKLRFNATHALTDVDVTINDDAHEGVLQAPGAWSNGGLPVSASGEPYGDDRRVYTASGASPFIANSGALDVQIKVATGAGEKTISVQVSAQERADNPDVSPGQWNAVFQQRLNDALNAAGVYVSADTSDLSQFTVAESTGQRLLSVTVNGAAVSYDADAPSFGLGGAFDARRSFTSAQAATGVSDDAPALIANDTVAITFDTVWGARTISAQLQPGDPKTLESAALRLNEALQAAGYDLGVAATPLSGGGAGLRLVTGSTDTVTRINSIALGATTLAATLDPIDAASHADDPVGAKSVADRAARDAAIVATTPYSGTSPYSAPADASAWFAGRDFDVSIGQGAKVLAARSVATAADGSVYVLADVSGLAGDQPVSADRDVALLKYDSAGKLIFTRVLGAADEAQGYALAVSPDGHVAIAGGVTGALSGASASSGGSDSFVTMYDASGKELWTQRRGASGDDHVTALAFASNNQLIVTGVTSSAMSGAVSSGGQDGYVRGYSASGTVLFTKQFGTNGADSADALTVRDVGGALEIYTGGVESGRGVVRKFTYASATGIVQGATRDLGNFNGGAITSLAHDGASLYVGGAIVADRLSVANTAQGASAGKEGFVARLDDDLISTGEDRASYLGSAQDDSVKALSIVNGDVYVMGQTGGVISGQGAANTIGTYVARLDDDGQTAWLRTFKAAGGAMLPTALAASSAGASVLDRLGLPNGAVASDNSDYLVQRSALRAGDEFSVQVEEGLSHKITVTAKDTMQSLALRIDSFLGSAGQARVVTTNGAQHIEITARDGRAIRITSGKDGKNALPALGISDGVIAQKTTAKGVIRTFGLGLLASDLKLTDADAITKTKNELAAATSIIRQAYDALANPNAKQLTAEEQAKQDKMKGAVPAYLTAQIANYQAALTRLTS